MSASSVPTASAAHEGSAQHPTLDGVAGRTVLVTGASGGIGAELVRAFLDAGASCVIAAARHRALPAGDRVEPLHLDLSCDDSVAAAAERVGRRVDIVVNNAGRNGNRRLDKASLEQARAEMEVNYFGLIRMHQAFGPWLTLRRGGCVVNMLTVLAHANLPLMATYCASKAAALSLTQAMRAELAPYGVRVLAVLPAAVDTAMSAAVPQPKLSPRQLAVEVVEAVQRGAEDLYPGTAAGLREALQKDWKAVERTLASRLPSA